MRIYRFQKTLFPELQWVDSFTFFKSNFQIWPFQATVCVLYRWISPSLCNVDYYKETIQLICSLHQLAGFYKIASTAKWRVSKMKTKYQEAEQVKLSKRQLQIFWSSHWRCFGKKSILKNICSKCYQVKLMVKIYEKYLWRSLFRGF